VQDSPTPDDSAEPAYPHELVDEFTTTDQRRLRMRPIRPSDAPGLVAFHAGLSDESVYRRYFSWHAELSSAEVARLTTVDYVDRLALVVEDGDALVAVGRYERFGDTDRAEVAFLVTDALQHRGIGGQLLAGLARAAYERGITTFIAETQSGNAEMLKVFSHSPFAMERRDAEGVTYVRLSLAPADRSVGA
jgi:GNAT superfamily N-acetyltransferase